MTVAVRDIAKGADVLAGGSGLNRKITVPQLLIAELAESSLKGDASSSILHVRPSQAARLCTLPRERKARCIHAMLKRNPACILVSGGTVCKELLHHADAAGIPVVKSGNVPSLRRLLIEKNSPQMSLHGVLVQIFGLGALILGESAVGKSEAALDLVLRGHKLIADDVVLLNRDGSEVIGSPTDMGADLLQIRGLGIINIRALYGESAILGEGTIGLVVELEEWQKGHQYSLIGLRERRYRLLGVNVPYLKLPVKLGRTMATLIEVAARNQMLKNRGVFTARELDKKLKEKLSR